MVKKIILKGGNEIADESGAADFNTDWHEITERISGRKLTLTAHFPNDLSVVGNIILEVSNTGEDAADGQEIDKVTVTTEEGIEEEMNWKFFRFRYKKSGTPTGGIISINAGFN